MADKAVSELIEAERITALDLFVLEQNGTAKKLTGQVLLNWLTAAADGHGGIQSIQKVSTSGLMDTYRITLADTTIFDFVVNNGRGISGVARTDTSGLVDTYTISYNDGTSGTFTVTNGAKGDKGDNTYTWIKYASQEPTAASHSFGDLPDAWIGIYFGSSSTAPTDWQQYSWYQIKGEKGDTGTPAMLVSSAVEYQASDSGTIIPSGTWSASVPVVAQGKYLWTRLVQQFNTGNPITAYSVSRMGIDGLGSVTSVGGVAPDADGDVPLTAESIGALSAAGGDMTGALRMNGQPISGLNAPTADDEAVNFGTVKELGKAKAGFIYPLASAVVPDGFLLCDGAAHSRSEYPELFAAIGTMYGSGDGSTTFNVPDLQTRVLVGSGDGYALGDSGGEETNTHKHLSPFGYNDTYGVVYFTNDFGHSEYNADNGAGYGRITDATEQNGAILPYTQPATISNMQPYVVVNYIIATGKDTAVSVADIILGAQAIPLAVEYGGTGATNPKAARENLEITPENIGAMSMKLLWENASPSSAFADQTLSIDLTGYNFVIIPTTSANTSVWIKPNFVFEVGKQSEFILTNSNSAFERSIIINNEGITFGKGCIYTLATSSKNENNIYVIPQRIYGIKGVS